MVIVIHATFCADHLSGAFTIHNVVGNAVQEMRRFEDGHFTILVQHEISASMHD